MNLNELAQRIHVLNAKWWQNPETKEPIERNSREMLALVISEVSECLEGERKDLMDDKLPHRKMAEVEMADTFIRLLDYAAGFKLHLVLTFRDQVMDNKGEALFLMMREICDIDTYGSRQISHCLAMIQAYCVKHGYDLMGAVEEKLKFNETREDHTHEARLIAGGKQF